MSSNSSELICYINEITDFHSLFAVWVLHYSGGDVNYALHLY